MKKLIFASFFILSLAVPFGVEALFDKCDFMPKESRPQWVNSGYSKEGYYTAVGLSEKTNSTNLVNFQSQSKQDAYSNLAQNITVVVDASIKNEQKVIKDKLKKDEFVKDISISLTLSSKEILSGVEVSGRWLDRKKCILYTSVEVKKSTVERLKREALMKLRVSQLNELLEIVKDKNKEPDINKRREAFGNAGRLFKEIDFKILKDELSKGAYLDKIKSAKLVLKKDIGSTKDRVLVAAITPKGSVPKSVVGRVLDFVKNSLDNADRLQGNCGVVDECLANAHKKGFSRLVLLDINTTVTDSEMGAYKGTLKVNKTVFDVSSKKILKGPDGSFAEVISWSDDELDWNLAADKIIKSKSSIAGI